MPANFGSRNSKLKNGGTISKVHDSVMAICSEDKRNAFIYPSPVNGNFQNEHGYATKPHIVHQYNAHMEYGDE
jgi:hypothetical protein